MEALLRDENHTVVGKGTDSSSSKIDGYDWSFSETIILDPEFIRLQREMARQGLKMQASEVADTVDAEEAEEADDAESEDGAEPTEPEPTEPEQMTPVSGDEIVRAEPPAESSDSADASDADQPVSTSSGTEQDTTDEGVGQ